MMWWRTMGQAIYVFQVILPAQAMSPGWEDLGPPIGT